MRKVLLLAFALLIPVSVSSQWSSNPAENLLISGLPGDQTLPRVVPTSDGGCYISWFDSRSGSYAVYIQRLSVDGVKQFVTDGLLVSNHPQNTSLVGYDLAVDQNDNAILAFTDLRNGSVINPFAYKISPSGTFLWGQNGVSLTDSADYFQANPKIAVTSDGQYVFAWIYASTPRKVAMQRLDSDGNKLWGDGPLKLSGTGAENLDWPGIVHSDSGSVIALWSGYTGSFISPQNYRLYTQKFSPTGLRIWNQTQDTVYSLGRVSGFYNPRIFPDGNNGALYCWQDDRDFDNLTSSFAQRYSASGQRLFPLNGSELSTQPSRNNFSPIGAVMNATNETYVFWSESNAGQTSSGGLYGQKLNPTGLRQWTDNGREFKPLDNNTFSGLGVFITDTNIVASINEVQFGSVNGLIKAMVTGPAGVIGWSGSLLTASSATGEKLHLNNNMTNTGMSLLVWSDRRPGAAGIYAQNINLNGTLGGGSNINHIPDLPSEFKLYQNYPNPFNPGTVINFQLPVSNYVTLKVYDIMGREIAMLVNGYLQAGYYNYQFTVENYQLPGGVYFYTLQAGTYRETKRMLLVK